MALDSTALTTVAAAREELAVRDASKLEPLERLINVASGLIARYCNRVLQYGTGITETVPGYGTDLLFLSRTPVVALASVTIDGSIVSPGTYVLKSAAAGTLYSPLGWAWTSGYTGGVIGQTRVAGAERKAHVVTYSGGYVTPEQSRLNSALTRTLPFEIEQACLYTVVHMHRLRGKFAAAVVETADAGAVVWQGMGIPSAAKAFLDPFRRAL